MQNLRLDRFDYSVVRGQQDFLKNEILIEFSIKYSGTEITDTIGKIDTGAAAIFIPGFTVGLDEDYVKSRCKPAYPKGIDNEPIKSYVVPSELVKLRSIEIMGFPTIVTFDRRVNRTLIGMQFLRMFYLYINPLRFELGLRETPELAEYTHNKKQVNKLINTTRQGIEDADSLIFINKHDIIAHDIYTKTKDI